MLIERKWWILSGKEEVKLNLLRIVFEKLLDYRFPFFVILFFSSGFSHFFDELKRFYSLLIIIDET